MLCCHSNATRAPIANPPNSAQLGGIPYHSPSYIRVRAIVWACGRGQTHRYTHRRAWRQYISCRLRLTRNVMTISQSKCKVSTKSDTQGLLTLQITVSCCYTLLNFSLLSTDVSNFISQIAMFILYSRFRILTYPENCLLSLQILSVKSAFQNCYEMDKDVEMALQLTSSQRQKISKVK